MILTAQVAEELLQINSASRYGRLLPPGKMLNAALLLMKKGMLSQDIHGVFLLTDSARWLMQGKFDRNIMSQ